MSYEIVKGIKIDNKRKKIFIRSSSNNVYPKDYNRNEFMKNESDLEKKKLELFYCILGGYFNLRICDNINWKYATCRFFDYCQENKIDVYELWNTAQEDERKESIKPYYKIFEKFLMEKHQGLYYLDSNIGKVIKITHKGFLYAHSKTPMDKYCYDYKTAYLKRNKLHAETIDKYQITINKFEKVKEQTKEGDLTL